MVKKKTLLKIKKLVDAGLPIGIVTNVAKIDRSLKITIQSEYLSDDELVEIWEQMNVIVNKTPI